MNLVENATKFVEILMKFVKPLTHSVKITLYLHGILASYYMAKKRITYEQQIVDVATGEVKVITTSSLRGNEETFVMGRTTAGFEWLKDLTALELKLIMIMVYNKSRNDNTVSLPAGRLTDIAITFDLSLITVQNTLRSIRIKGLIKEISRGVYLVSPLTFYSGGTSNWKSMYEEYNSVNDIKY